MKENNKVILGCGLVLLGLIGFSQIMAQREKGLATPPTPPVEATKASISSPPISYASAPVGEEAAIATPTEAPSATATPTPTPEPPSFDLSMVPAYSDKAYVEVNGNEPFFQTSDLTTSSFESYSPLDSLGRCGVAYACVGQDIMPTEERGAIGMIKPSGWETVRYDDLVDGKYLYNRCHLIGYQLTGENANERNLITGTRYMNTEGMLPNENKVANHVKSSGNHVLYRVTPMDQFGLDKIDNRILSTIIRKFHGGPVGLNTIATAIGEDPGTIEEVYEPYLIQQGFIKRTARGREATVLAYEHLGVNRADDLGLFQ